ncbi:MAG: hypothetical protein ABIA93_01355 [Candidatus Woesearchaeota archaeon]
MVHFTHIKPSEHYLREHSREVPWSEAVKAILSTKNPRKKGDTYEIRTESLYLVFALKNDTLVLINAKRMQK